MSTNMDVNDDLASAEKLTSILFVEQEIHLVKAYLYSHLEEANLAISNSTRCRGKDLNCATWDKN